MTGLNVMIIAGNPDDISTQVFRDDENGKYGGAIWFNDKAPSGFERPRPLVSFNGHFETEEEAQAHLDELIEFAKKHAPDSRINELVRGFMKLDGAMWSVIELAEQNVLEEKHCQTQDERECRNRQLIAIDIVKWMMGDRDGDKDHSDRG